jgi:hypothetical protein
MRPTLYQLSQPSLSGKKTVRGPGIEPGSTAWKAAMLTITPATLDITPQQRPINSVGRVTGS